MPSEASVATYHRVAELERAGVSRHAAFDQVAEREGLTRGAVSQRYYVTKPKVTGLPAPGRPKPSSKASRNGDGADLGTLIETAALMVLEAARHVAELEADAARWREVAAILDR